MEHLLPLADHAHIVVVEDEDFDRQAVLGEGGQLLDVHHEAGFAGNADDRLVRVGDLDAQRRGHAVAHSAEATGGHPTEGLFEFDKLRRPHLVLADIGGDVRVGIFGEFVEAIQRVLGFDDVGALVVAEAFLTSPSIDFLPPLT